MAATATHVLAPEDLNGTDKQILEELREGRVTPALIADRRGIDRSYVSQRLIRLEEHNHVEELVRGVYELARDPRDT
jgi:DNA-binding MarR family transcriptional regulator